MAKPHDARPAPGMGGYIAGVAAASTAYIAAYTAAALAAKEITGSAALSGVPNSVGVAGTAIGAGLLSTLMARRGRRSGLVVGYLVAAAGGLAALTSVVGRSFPLLVVAGFLFGLGYSAVQLTRYAASDALAPAERTRAVGTVVWASTIGAVLGPNLLQPAGSVAGLFGRGALEGAFAFALLAFVVAAVVSLVALPPGVPPAALDGGDGQRIPWRTLLGANRVRVALLGMVTGQVVMVLIMTMTPVHVRDGGHDLGTVGIVISAHTLGMFALSPLSGRLAAMFGEIPVLYGGFATLLLAALLGAIAPTGAVTLLTLALFLLGFGWNLGFVAGSSLLTRGASLAERIRLQGVTDMVVWTAAAIASAGSGLILQLAGFAALSLVGAVLIAVPVLGIASLRDRIAADSMV